MAIKILEPNQNFRGMSYGDWIEVWSNWLFSSYPNYVPDEDILFCRGFLEYSGSAYDITQQQYIIEAPTKPPGSKPTKNIIRTTEKRLLLNKDEDSEEVDLSDVVPTGTAIFFPLLTAMYSIGHTFEGRTLDNEFDVRRAVMKDTYESREVFFKLRKPKGELRRLDLLEYRFETRLFPIRISDSSPFIGYHFEDIQPGTFESVAGGYFVIVTDLPKGEYTFEFGGKGRDGYRTRTIHRVVVREERRNLIRDSSALSPVTLIQ